LALTSAPYTIQPQRHGGTETARKVKELNEITEAVIGCAIEVHRQLGPGLLEASYESALCIELDDAGLRYQRQTAIPAVYKGRTIGEYRLDLLVEDAVIIEIKSVERFDPVFQAQLLTYLRVTGKKIGLLINFNSGLLKDGIRRYAL
jgi:GxxExxY protein